MTELFVKEILAIAIVVLSVEVVIFVTLCTITMIVDSIKRIWRGW